MAKKINLTEKQLHKALNEISYGTVSGARDINNDLFGDITYSFERFYEEIDNLDEALQNYQNDLYQNRNFNIYRQSTNNRYQNQISSLSMSIESHLSEIKTCADRIKAILDRKNRQLKNFDDAILKADTNADWTEDNTNREIRDLQ